MTLIGYSLGARVMFACLVELADQLDMNGSSGDNNNSNIDSDNSRSSGGSNGDDLNHNEVPHIIVNREGNEEKSPLLGDSRAKVVHGNNPHGTAVASGTQSAAPGIPVVPWRWKTSPKEVRALIKDAVLLGCPVHSQVRQSNRDFVHIVIKAFTRRT